MSKINTEFKIKNIIDCLIKTNLKVESYRNPELINSLGTLSSEEAFDEIKNIKDLNNNQKADLCYELFLTTMEPYFVYKAGNLSSDYYFLAWVTGSLIKEDFDSLSIRQKTESYWNKSIVENFFNNLEFSNQDLNEDYAIFYDLIPSGKISELQKQSQVSNLTKHPEEKVVGWYHNSIKVTYNQANEIGDFKGGKLYGILSSEYDIEIWINALKKGFVKGFYGLHGVKLLNNKILELKIGGDNRLYTKIVYKNKLGDYLAIFDNQTDHMGIEHVLHINAIKKSKSIFIDENCLSIPHDCLDENAAISTSLIGSIDHIDNVPNLS